MLADFFAPLAVKILSGTAVVLLLVVGALWLSNASLRSERDNALERVGHLEATIDQIEAAQEQARIAARNQRLEQEARYRQLAEETDARVEQARVDAMDAAERYIARNRVRAAPDRSASGTAGTSAGNSGAGSGDGPGEDAELDGVVVMAEDIRICTENTLRLQEVRRWTLQLAGGAE